MTQNRNLSVHADFLTSSGVLNITGGGTGQTTASAGFNALSPVTSTGDLIVGNGTNTSTRLAIGTNGQFLQSNGTTAVWSTTLSIGNGGTGQTTAATAFNALSPITSVGDLIIGNGTNAATRLAIGTNGQFLQSNGTIAGWSTTLGLANGGTGQTTASAGFNALSPITSTGDLIIGNGTNSATRLAIGTNNQVLTSNGTTATWSTPSTGVSSITFGTTGLTPNTATTGTVTVAGTLAIGNGGTGQTTASAAFNALSPITSTGDLIIGNGTNAATRLAIGTNNQVLTSNGTTATWATPAGGGAMTLISTQTASSSSSIAWTGLTLDKYVLIINNLTPSASDQIVITFGTGAGPTYLSSGYYYQNIVGGTSSVTGVGNSSTGKIFLYANAGANTRGVSGIINFTGLTNTSAATLTGNTVSIGTSSQNLVTGGVNPGAQVTAIQLTYNGSANFSSGSASLYSISS
jgi:hypothetical protein